MSHKPNTSLNTIFAAILVAGITGMLAGFISRQVITPEFLHEDAFPIEVTESAGPGGASGPTGPDPILALIATADLAKGEALHKQCAACHDFTKGGPDRVGPNLWGVINGPKAHRPSFAYSDGLKNAGGSWSYDDLNHFLWKPKSLIADTKMNFIGIKKPEDRAALIAWLRAQADSPAALPSEADIANEAAAAAPAETEATPEDAEAGAIEGEATKAAPGAAPANTGTTDKKEDPATHTAAPSPDTTKPAEAPAPENAKP